MQKNEADILECIKQLGEGLKILNQGLIKLDARITKLETSTATYSIEGRRLNK